MAKGIIHKRRQAFFYFTMHNGFLVILSQNLSPSPCRYLLITLINKRIGPLEKKDFKELKNNYYLRPKKKVHYTLKILNSKNILTT
jgi:hypothetical protein